MRDFKRVEKRRIRNERAAKNRLFIMIYLGIVHGIIIAKFAPWILALHGSICYNN